jgi:[ribosomal protein S5]-alanine N-acetyltransferase
MGTGEKKSRKHNMSNLISNRLELVVMKPTLLEAFLAGDHILAARIAGFHVPNDLILSKSLLKMRLGQLQVSPEIRPWLVRAIVIRQSQTMCGHVGFHSEPGPEDLRDIAADGVELGYSVSECFRKQGYAKEAVFTLMKWAFESYQQQCFILSIEPDNEASLAMAHSMGFKEIGSHIDDEDGLELYFERRLEHWPEEWII